MDDPLANVTMLQIFFCALGLLSHMLTTLMEMSQARGCTVTPFDYMQSRPYKVSMALIGAIVGFVILAQMQELTLLTAFGAGMASNDMADRFGKMTTKRLEGS